MDDRIEGGLFRHGVESVGHEEAKLERFRALLPFLGRGRRIEGEEAVEILERAVAGVLGRKTEGAKQKSEGEGA